MKGGQLKESLNVSKAFVKTSGNITKDLAKGMSKIIGGMTNGLEIVAKTAGNTLDNLSKNLEISSAKVLSHVGDLGLKASKELGNVVQIIPILGKPSAYVVKGAGRGVYYVVTSVGNVVGKSVRSVGRVGKEVSDLVVFTISATSTLTEKTLEEAGDIVKKVSHSLIDSKKTKKAKKTKKTKKANKTKKAKKAKKSKKLNS